MLETSTFHHPIQNGTVTVGEKVWKQHGHGWGWAKCNGAVHCWGFKSMARCHTFYQWHAERVYQKRVSALNSVLEKKKGTMHACARTPVEKKKNRQTYAAQSPTVTQYLSDKKQNLLKVFINYRSLTKQNPHTHLILWIPHVHHCCGASCWVLGAAAEIFVVLHSHFYPFVSI